MIVPADLSGGVSDLTTAFLSRDRAADPGYERSGRSARPLRALHRRGGGGDRRDHHADPLDPHDGRVVQAGSLPAQIGRKVRGSRPWTERFDRDLSFKTVLTLLRLGDPCSCSRSSPAFWATWTRTSRDRTRRRYLIAIFAFFFVTVSSRIVGLVGVTSNPTSGMTIATLLATSSAVFLGAGLDRRPGQGHRADGRNGGLHRRVDSRRHLAGSENRLRPRGNATPDSRSVS